MAPSHNATTLRNNVKNIVNRHAKDGKTHAKMWHLAI